MDGTDSVVDFDISGAEPLCSAIRELVPNTDRPLEAINLPVQLTHFIFFPVALRPNAGHGLLIHEVSRSHTATHHSR